MTEGTKDSDSKCDTYCRALHHKAQSTKVKYGTVVGEIVTDSIVRPNAHFVGKTR